MRRLGQADAAIREAIAVLRDVAQLLGIAPSRVSQIEKQANPVSSA